MNPWLAFLIELSIKVLLVVTVCAAATQVKRRLAASARVLVWRLCLCGVVAVPVLMVAGPDLLIPILPATVPHAASASSNRSSHLHSQKRLISQPPNEGAVLLSSGNLATLSASASRLPDADADADADAFRSALVWAWALGATLICLRELLGVAALGRLLVGARPADPRLRDIAEEVAHPSASVRILTSNRASVPITWGWRNPIVLLPLDCEFWPELSIRAALAHELAHIRHRDWLWSRIAMAACSLFWFHPAVWWAAARLRAEAELASDDFVLLSGIPASEYATCLVEVVRMLKGHRPANAVSMAQSARVAERLHRILDPRVIREARRPIRLAVIGLTAATTFAVAALSVTPRASAAGSPVTAMKLGPSAKVTTLRVSNASGQSSKATIERRAMEEKSAAERRAVERRAAELARKMRQHQAELTRLRSELDRLTAGSHGTGALAQRERALVERERFLAEREARLRALERDLASPRHRSDSGRRDAADTELRLESRLKERELQTAQELMRSRVEQAERELVRARAQFEAGLVPLRERAKVEAELEKARIDLNRAMLEADQKRREAERMRLNLQGEAGKRAREASLMDRLKVAEADLARAEVERRLQETLLDEVTQRHKAGISPIEEVERAELRVKESRAQVNLRRAVITELSKALKTRETDQKGGKGITDPTVGNGAQTNSLPILGDLPIIGRLFRKSGG